MFSHTYPSLSQGAWGYSVVHKLPSLSCVQPSFNVQILVSSSLHCAPEESCVYLQTNLSHGIATICFNIHQTESFFHPPRGPAPSLIHHPFPSPHTKHIVGAQEMHLEEIKMEDVELSIKIHLLKSLSYSFVC